MLSDYTPMAPTLVRTPFHRNVWVYKEKIDGWRTGARGEVAIYEHVLRSRFEWLREPDPDAVTARP